MQEIMLLCYHRFRDETNETMDFDPMIDMFVSYDDEGWFTPSLGSVALATSENEPTYLAALICWFDQDYFYRYDINVYRYQPDDEEEKWHKIASKSAELYESGISKQDYLDVALAVDGDDVIVLWTISDDDEGQNSICGYRIEGASTVNFDNDFTIGTKAFLYADEGNLLSMLSADWDPHDGVGTARVVWQEYQEYINYKAVIWPGRVNFDPITHQPFNMTRYDYLNPISGSSSYSAMNPVVVVNRPALPGLNMSNTYEAFAGYALGSDIKQNDCNVDEYTYDDEWEGPVLVNPNQSSGYNDTSLTYRAFGNTKHIWRYNNIVYLDDYVLNEREVIGTKALKLTTNRENRTDIYSSYKQYSNDEAKIMIQQLEP